MSADWIPLHDRLTDASSSERSPKTGAEQRWQFFGNRQRLHRLRWVSAVAAVMFLVVGVSEVILDGSVLHVVVGTLFLLMSLTWAPQTWGGCNRRSDRTPEAASEDQSTGSLETFGSIATREGQPAEEIRRMKRDR